MFFFRLSFWCCVVFLKQLKLCVSSEVWKRFLDDGSSKLDLKKKGDEFVNAVDGWFQSQESQVDTALKVAWKVATGTLRKGSRLRDNFTWMTVCKVG